MKSEADSLITATIPYFLQEHKQNLSVAHDAALHMAPPLISHGEDIRKQSLHIGFWAEAAVSKHSILSRGFYHTVFGTSLHFQYRDTGAQLAYGNPALEMSRAWSRHTVAPAPIFEASISNLKMQSTTKDKLQIYLFRLQVKVNYWACKAAHLYGWLKKKM